MLASPRPPGLTYHLCDMTERDSTGRCAQCSATLPSGARFCLTCGHPVDAAAAPTMTSPPGERTPAYTAKSSDSFDHGRFAPGTMVGDRYRVVGRLGVGGMGEVFRADDLKLGQPVALKFLPENVERDPVAPRSCDGGCGARARSHRCARCVWVLHGDARAQGERVARRVTGRRNRASQ